MSSKSFRPVDFEFLWTNVIKRKEEEIQVFRFRKLQQNHAINHFFQYFNVLEISYCYEQSNRSYNFFTYIQQAGGFNFLIIFHSKRRIDISLLRKYAFYVWILHFKNIYYTSLDKNSINNVQFNFSNCILWEIRIYKENHVGQYPIITKNRDLDLPNRDNCHNLQIILYLVNLWFPWPSL